MSEQPRDPRAGDAFLTALVEEACRKSSMLWLSYAGSERPRPAWHVWTDGAALVVGAATPESPEQALPGLDTAERAVVTCRAKDSRARLITWVATVSRVEPGTPAWNTACAALTPNRLNATDVGTLQARWSSGSTAAFVVRLEPTGEVTERPGAMPTTDGSSPPPDSPATTRARLPWVLHRRGRRARRLS